MPKYLEPNEVIEAIERAFSPLECRVELYDDRNRLGFSVFDIDGNAGLLPVLSNFAVEHLCCRLVVEAQDAAESLTPTN